MKVHTPHGVPAQKPAKVKYRCISDRIIVMRAQAAEMSTGKGGAEVIIPKDAQVKPCSGMVIAIGPGLILTDGSRGPMEVAKGENVLFSSYAGLEVEGSPGLLVMRQDDILLVKVPG